MMRSFDMTCPFCGTVNKEHGGPGEHDNPSDGDISLCWNCAKVSVYTMAARKPTREEQERYDNDPEVIEAQAAILNNADPGEMIQKRWKKGEEDGSGTEE